ncbi:MAG: glycosyltransferase family 2 protein [Acidobacteriota bacterium]|nr:glycosyltransferase family 2 protein [Acidobacteriota bacterium]
MTNPIAQPETNWPFVSVVMPVRNEAAHIADCLAGALGQDYPQDCLEVLVADGDSTDATPQIIAELHVQHPNLRLIPNPRQITPTGLNAAILAARGEIIARMDAHTEYAPDYLRQCVMVLKETGAQNVGGAARTKATGYLQQAISLAYHSPFSAGGARFHNVEYEGEVDTVTYGCWRKETLLDLGLFDEELVRNQDDELNLRLTRQGGKIWQSARIRSWYHPRASLTALLRQYSQYGYWKVRVIQKHKIPASWRHLVPGAWLGSLFVLLALAPFSRWFLVLLLLHLFTYLLANLTATVLTCRRTGQLQFLPILPIVFACYHFGYGFGFLRGLVDFVLFRRGARESFSTLTRGKTR